MLIGLFNVAGSLSAGWLGQRYRMKYLLAMIYASRALIVALYVVMPKTALNVYLFAGALGFTWLATVPPTSLLVRSAASSARGSAASRSRRRAATNGSGTPTSRSHCWPPR